MIGDHRLYDRVDQFTAELDVTGYASKPRISLRSTPALPQDQVMALLLFGTDASNVSPLQIAAALASLSGGGGGGFDPSGAIRNTLGLDRLSVGSGSGTGHSNNTGASIEGGKYITKRVYVGARQSTAGGGTQALGQIDITKRLKAFTTVGSGGTVTGATTPENDPGSSVGLKYQFRYQADRASKHGAVPRTPPRAEPLEILDRQASATSVIRCATSVRRSS